MGAQDAVGGDVMASDEWRYKGTGRSVRVGILGEKRRIEEESLEENDACLVRAVHFARLAHDGECARRGRVARPVEQLEER